MAADVTIGSPEAVKVTEPDQDQGDYRRFLKESRRRARLDYWGRFALTVLAVDRPGVIAAVAGRLYEELECNVEGSLHTVLAGRSALLLSVSTPPGVPDADLSQTLLDLKTDMPDLQFQLESAFDEPEDPIPDDAREWRLSASFPDRRAALAELAAVFGRRRICVLRVSSYLSLASDGDIATISMDVAIPYDADFVGIRRDLLDHERSLGGSGWAFREKSLGDDEELNALIQGVSVIEEGCRALTVVGHAKANLVATVFADLASIGIDLIGCSMAVLDHRTVLMLLLRKSSLTDLAIERSLDRAADEFKLALFLAEVPPADEGLQYGAEFQYCRMYAQLIEQAGAFAAITQRLAALNVSVLWSQTSVIGERPPACVVELVAAAQDLATAHKAKFAMEALAHTGGWFEVSWEIVPPPTSTV